MRDVWIIGTHSTAFAKRPESSFKDLTRETYLGVLADAGLGDGDDIATAWFGNCLMHTWGQGGIRGQVSTIELVDEGLFPRRVPIINVEGACATASMALHGAVKDIRSGDAEVSLAMGVEKTYRPGAEHDPAVREEMFDAYRSGIDNFDEARLVAEYEKLAAYAGCSFERGPGRTMFMDTYAIQAAVHMARHGTTQAQIAAGAAKNHTYGAANPLAQYRFPMSVDEVLADRLVSWPLTRAMCAPIGDGAASAIVCSSDYLLAQPPAVRERAVQVKATVLTGGYTAPSTSRRCPRPRRSGPTRWRASGRPTSTSPRSTTPPASASCTRWRCSGSARQARADRSSPRAPPGPAGRSRSTPVAGWCRRVTRSGPPACR